MDVTLLNAEIKRIANDCNIYKENFKEFGEAERVSLDIIPDDHTFRTVEGDCACALYTTLHAICRIPQLKEMFFKNIRRSNTNYYFVTIKYPNKVCYKIPIKTIKLEKETNICRLFPSNIEIISAISVFAIIKTYEYLNFFERTSYFTILDSLDIFFNQPVKNIGIHTEAYGDSGKIFLKTSEHIVELIPNGDIKFDDETYTGQMIICFADYKFMTKLGRKEGHATVL